MGGYEDVELKRVKGFAKDAGRLDARSSTNSDIASGLKDLVRSFSRH